MGLRSKLLIAGAAASLVVAGSVGLAGASEDLPAGDYTIEVPGVGTVAFAVDTDGAATVTALPEGFTLAADEEVEAEDLALTVDGTVYEVEFEAENDDEGLTAEIEGEARDDDEDETDGPDDAETDGPDDDETDGPEDDETDEPDDDETDEPDDDETDGPDDEETDGPDDEETEDDEDEDEDED